MDTTPKIAIFEENAELADSISRDIVSFFDVLTCVSVYSDEPNNRYLEITLPLHLPGGWKVEMLAEENGEEFIIRGYDAPHGDRFEIDMLDNNESFLWRQLYHHSFRCTPEDGLEAVCTRDTLAETACRFGALMQAIAFCRYYNR